LNIDKLIKYWKLIRPKYYNTLTRILVLSGIMLLSKPLWLDFLNIFFEKLELSLIGENDWKIGLITIVIALIYNIIHRYIDLNHERKSKPAFENVNKHKLKSFGELCQEIIPILNDNKYIFETTGPNSNIENLEPLRTDLTIWNKLKNEVIAPNNLAIKKLIELNQNLIPNQYENVFRAMVLHIDAFDEHLRNPEFDYSNFQFPKEFQKITLDASFEEAKTDRSFLKKINWLERRIAKTNTLEWFIFGSTVYTPAKANDFDIAMLVEHISIQMDNKLSKEIDALKFDYKIKFKQDLHLTIFNKSEKLDYETFADNNTLKIEM
tara:strand:- start:10756 stop:11721 length:966 start_codon:yes stop_codon:yes gene_type:complete